MSARRRSVCWVLCLWVWSCVLASGRSASAVLLEAGTGDGHPGDEVQITISLTSQDEDVGGFENDITYDIRYVDVQTFNDDPFCELNHDLVGQTRMSAGLATTGANTVRLHVQVTPLTTDEALPDGAVYTCHFDIQPRVPEGVYDLTMSGASAERPDGVPFQKVSVLSGAIQVENFTQIFVTAEDVCAVPGAVVSVPVLFDAGGHRIATVRNEIAFDPSTLSIRVRDREPDCTGNFDTKKALTVLPASDSSLRFGMLPLFNRDPIPDGEIYRCNWQVAADAFPGDYELFVGNIHVLDADDAEITGAQGVNGTIRVTRQCCIADCHTAGEVGVADIVLGVDIALGNTPLDHCPGLDPNRDGVVSIDELVLGVRQAMHGCTR